MDLAVSEVFLGQQRIFTGTVRDISERRELEQQIIQISEYERQRIGQELHDALGSQLTGIGLICSHLVRQARNADPSLAEELSLVASQVKEADYMARNIARGLVPVASEPVGLLQALRRLCETARRVYGIACSFEGDDAALIGNYVKSTHLYRIAQEALNNAIKHGHASEVVVHLTLLEPGSIKLGIVDNGMGFPEVLPRERGIGVRTMHYRANLIGGNLTIERLPEGGTRVACYLPGVSSGVGKE
jgi:signal transduction histidine kinase